MFFLQYIQTIPLLPNDINWFSMVTAVFPVVFPVTSLFLAWYGVKRFWPDFKKQTRAEHLVENAKRSLQYVVELEEAVIEFSMLCEDCTTKACPCEGKELSGRFKILASINKLRNALLWLQSESAPIEDAELQKLVLWTKRLDELVRPASTNGQRTAISSRILDRVGIMEDNALRPEALEELKQALMVMYEVRKTKDNSLTLFALCKQTIAYMLTMLLIVGLLVVIVVLLYLIILFLEASLFHSPMHS